MRAWLRRMLLHRVSRRRVATGGPPSAGSRASVPPRIGLVAGPGRLARRRLHVAQRPAARGEEEAAVLAALDRLPERMRQVIVWRHREDCSFEEIGRRLERSNVAARKLWLLRDPSSSAAS